VATDGTLDPRVERSRQVIRQAAVEELGDKGYGAFTIESVAARAGVSKSTIYRHWPDKLALITDSFEIFHEQSVPATDDDPPRLRVTRLVRHVAEIIADSIFSRCIPALVEGAERDQRLREFHHHYNTTRRHELTAAITDGVANGSFPAHLDPELAALQLLGPIFYHRLLDGDPFPPDQVDNLINAVLGPHLDIRPVGRVESTLTDPNEAPRQGHLGTQEAWLVFNPDLRPALRDLAPDTEIIVLTWLDRARRDVLRTYPGRDSNAPERGVFNLRSPDRPNPVGLHRVLILSVDDLRVQVRHLEAINGTPIVDIKPVLKDADHS
jgi:tRNA-Thr(GGU) m(6)t(6)A37 methyltransferase TsaA